MLTRIVRMEFDPEKISDFLDVFYGSVDRIKGSEGCLSVRLKIDSQQRNVYYTHSEWLDEDHLNQYRNSDFFKETWSKTKQLFCGKPQAFSLIDP